MCLWFKCYTIFDAYFVPDNRRTGDDIGNEDYLEIKDDHENEDYLDDEDNLKNELDLEKYYEYL